MKSLAMLNLNRISPIADFCSEIKALKIQLDIINQNLLYCTHMDDKILKIVNKLVTDDNIQKQVDEYFDETSHQTDSDEQETPE